MKHLKKFNSYIILESHGLLNNYSLTETQEYNYMLKVRNILREKYPTYEETIKDGTLQRLIDDDLNWVSGNRVIRQEIIKEYKVKNYYQLLDVIEKNKEKIFVDDIDRYLGLIKKTKETGDKSELYAINKLYEMLGGESGDFIIKRPSKQDVDYIEGVDLEIKSKTDPNVHITCQVKSAVKSYSEGLYFKIESSGGVKRYETDLICFTSKNGIALFLLDDYKVEDKYFFLRKKDYVKNIDQFYLKVMSKLAV